MGPAAYSQRSAMTRRLAIDPGDVHVGYAYGERDVTKAGEWTPEECVENLVQMLTRNEVDEIVIEEYVLYQQEYANQAWSPMLTPQLIGAIKLVAHWFRIPIVEQGAYAKKPTRAKMKRLGIRHVGTVIHSMDAELHFHHRRMREEAACRGSS
jgi:hypothetical protein